MPRSRTARATRSGTRWSTPALGLVLALATACSGGGEGDGDGPPEADRPATSSAPGTTAPGSPAPGSDAPAVEAVWPKGRVVDLGVLTVRVPKAWKVVEQPVGVSYLVFPPGDLSILVAALPTYGEPGEADGTGEVPVPVSEMERRLREIERGNDTFRLRKPREVAGVLMARASSRSGAWSNLHLAVEHGGRQVHVNVKVRGRTPPVRDPLVDRFLSTVEWRDGGS